MDPITYQTPNELSLELRIPTGEVTVRATDTGQTTLRISGERAPDEVTVRFDDGADGRHHLVVQQRRPGRGGWRLGALTVTVDVPEHTHVTVEGGSTDLVARGRLLSAAFLSGSGDATFDAVDDRLNVKVASGSLRAGRVGGLLTFHSASGTLRAQQCTGGLVARAASGDLIVGQADGDLRLTTLSGDVQLDAVGSGAVSVNAVSGDVSIGVLPGATVYLDLSSTSGAASSDLPVSELPPTSGERSLSVTATSVSGDVRVHRAAVRGSAA